MTEELTPRPSDPSTPADGTPTWLRALQAGLVGLVAGLVLHALAAALSLQAGSADPAHAGPKECKRSSPAPDVSAPPAADVPAGRSVRPVPLAL